MILIITTLFIHKINSVMCISIKVKVGRVCSLKNRGLRGKNECIPDFCHLFMSSLLRSCHKKVFGMIIVQMLLNLKSQFIDKIT